MPDLPRRAALPPLAALLLAARPARAHSLLTGASPRDGATLETAPEEVVLRFNEGTQLTALRLFAADGAEWPLARPRDLAARPEHRARLARPLPPGAWRVVWRAISADGHEIGGTIRFTLRAPA
jgi:methionine-rich copper-binding protein CopC